MSEGALQDFAGEIQAGQAPRPRWLAFLPYLLVLWGLGYFVSTAGDGGLEGPNLVFLILLAIWLVYTPLALRKKWFALPL
jgi:hypothetical protein